MGQFTFAQFLVALLSTIVVISLAQNGPGLGGPGGGAGGRGMNRDASWKREAKKANAKLERMTRAIEVLEKSPIPSFFKKDAGTPEHNLKGPVILAAAMSTDMRKPDANMFAKSARLGGYDGDLVFSILPNSMPGFMEVLRETKAITYTVNPNCTGLHHDKKCRMSENGVMVSINMIRFHMYQWWARMYSPDALIMISDFRDVFFQGNPFTYHTSEWAPPVSQMVVFQEVYPNKVIYRCPFNAGWIENCYGKDGLNRVGGNTVSCSGVSIGTRNAILLYAHLITQQLDPRVRMGRNFTGAAATDSQKSPCISLGMDQGFHNWLVYSGQLEKYMDLKIYQQGEGPVNTVGAFFGDRAILKWDLNEWKVLRGTAPNQYVANWNGDPSPVVHQADRFLNREFGGNYETKLKVANDVNK